MMLMTGLWMSA